MMQPMLDRARFPRAPRALRPHLPAIALAIAVLGGTAGPAAAAPKKYHFELAAVTPKPEIKADVGKAAVPRVEGQLKKVLETHPQLVSKLEGAPEKDKVDAFRKYLAQKGIAGAHLVTVEITEASEELEPMDKPNSQRFSVTIAVHLLGETIPGRTISFTGDGRAKVKQEIGKKLRPRDREVAWDEAAKVAIDDAMKTVFQQLAKPTPKKK
jgi:hypothetical protein